MMDVQLTDPDSVSAESIVAYIKCFSSSEKISVDTQAHPIHQSG